MSFLPDVKVPCETCHGALQPETLAVTWRGKSIGDVLQMEWTRRWVLRQHAQHCAPAAMLLKAWAWATSPGPAPSPTLSGGEAQRIKLVTRTDQGARRRGPPGPESPHTCTCWTSPPWACTWPTRCKLIPCCTAWFDGGHSVVVIEHDLDVIAEADWIIDLGPEGGNAGGRIKIMGTI